MFLLEICQITPSISCSGKSRGSLGSHNPSVAMSSEMSNELHSKKIHISRSYRSEVLYLVSIVFYLPDFHCSDDYKSTAYPSSFL